MDRPRPSRPRPSSRDSGPPCEAVASSAFERRMETTLLAPRRDRCHPRHVVRDRSGIATAEHVPTNRRSASQRALVGHGDRGLHGGSRGGRHGPAQCGLAAGSRVRRVGRHSGRSRFTHRQLLCVSWLVGVGHRCGCLGIGSDRLHDTRARTGTGRGGLGTHHRRQGAPHQLGCLTFASAPLTSPEGRAPRTPGSGGGRRGCVSRKARRPSPTG